MSDHWTQQLISPLRESLAQTNWRRVDEYRRGGWLALKHSNVQGAFDWYLIPSHGGAPKQLSLEEDSKLAASFMVAHWSKESREPELLAYRVGRRAVFRLRQGQQSSIAKLHKNDDHTLLRWNSLSPSHDWRTPTVLSWEPETRCLELEEVAGTSLHQSVKGGRSQLHTTERLTSLFEWMASQNIPEGLPTYSAQDEIQLLETCLARRRRLLQKDQLSNETWTRVCSSLSQLSSTNLQLTHRDLHDKQVLFDQGGHLGFLIDLDQLCAAPATVDAANLLAHLFLRQAQGSTVPFEKWGAELARPYLSSGLGANLVAWTASSMMRLALIYATRHHREGLLEQLATATDQVLKRSDRWGFLR